MVTNDPYLPDIMRGVIGRVDSAFFGRATDPFHVFFDKGIYSQVSRSVYENKANFPLVWLVMNFIEKRGADYSVWGDITCNLIIAMPTDNKYSQQERDDLVFGPRLIPIYELLLQQIARERWFQFKGPNQIEHSRILRPYWGGGDVNGADTPNLFKQQIDAISITGLKLKIKLKNCNTNPYPLITNTNF